MKAIKIKELRALSKEELFQKQKVFKKELFDLYYKRKFGDVEKTSRFETLRRDIARIQTLLREK